MKSWTVLALSAVGVLAHAEYLLFSNGAWITTPPVNTPTIGATPGDSQRNPAPPGTGFTGFGDFGWPVGWLPDGQFDGAADDFTLPNAWRLTRIRLFAYESGALTTDQTLTGAFLRIWRERPSGPRLLDNLDPRIVAGAIGTGSEPTGILTPMAQVVADPLSADPMAPGPGRSVWTGVFRTNFPGHVLTTRPVMAVDFDARQLANYSPVLMGGTYWLEVSMTGSTAGIEAWLPAEQVGGARAVDISAGNYVDATGSGAGRTDALGRPNPRPSIDFMFELYGLRVGDANADGAVNLTDFLILAAAYDTSAGDPAFEPGADFDASGTIDLADFLLLAANYDG
jgi:hypothetical protein